MSRSFKKTMKGGITTASSEKKDKRRANRSLRRKNSMEISSGSEDVFTIKRENSNVWSFSKDGKRFFKKRNFCVACNSISCSCIAKLRAKFKRK